MSTEPQCERAPSTEVLLQMLRDPECVTNYANSLYAAEVIEHQLEFIDTMQKTVDSIQESNRKIDKQAEEQVKDLTAKCKRLEQDLEDSEDAWQVLKLKHEKTLGDFADYRGRSKDGYKRRNETIKKLQEDVEDWRHLCMFLGKTLRRPT